MLNEWSGRLGNDCGHPLAQIDMIHHVIDQQNLVQHWSIQRKPALTTVMVQSDVVAKQGMHWLNSFWMRLSIFGKYTLVFISLLVIARRPWCANLTAYFCNHCGRIIGNWSDRMLISVLTCFFCDTEYTHIRMFVIVIICNWVSSCLTALQRLKVISAWRL